MLKICASICVLMGSVVMLYIVGSGAAGGRSSHPAPSWIYAHY